MKWEEVAACTRDDDTVSHGRGLTSRHVFYRFTRQPPCHRGAPQLTLSAQKNTFLETGWFLPRK